MQRAAGARCRDASQHRASADELTFSDANWRVPHAGGFTDLSVYTRNCGGHRCAYAGDCGGYYCAYAGACGGAG